MQDQSQLPGQAGDGDISNGTQHQEGATELSAASSPTPGVGHPMQTGTLAERHPPPAQRHASRGTCEHLMLELDLSPGVLQK